MRKVILGRLGLRSLLFVAAFFVTLQDAPAAEKKKAGKEKILSREAKARKGESNKINFDESAIAGERRTPLGSMINQNKNDKNYDLVKIRLRWHPEMIQSTSSLESGSK